MKYRVSWEIDIHAESHREAARKAQEIQRKLNSLATVFDVTDANDVRRVVDLEEADEDNMPAVPANHRSDG